MKSKKDKNDGIVKLAEKLGGCRYWVGSMLILSVCGIIWFLFIAEDKVGYFIGGLLSGSPIGVLYMRAIVNAHMKKIAP